MLPLPTESIAARYREIYIHSKLLLIDDSFFTLGSANLNLRSMAVDAEINVGTDDRTKSEDLRKRVWKLHTGNAADCNPSSLTPQAMSKAFRNWVQLLRANEIARKKGDAPTGFLHPFYDERETGVRFS